VRIFLDANVLYSKVLMPLFLDMAEAKIVTYLWSDEVMNEFEKNRIKKHPTHSAQISSTVKDIRNAFSGGEVVAADYAAVKASLVKTDLKDRHVLAAASVAGAQRLITFNISDFNKSEAKKLKVAIQHPDDFLCFIFAKNKQKVLSSVKHTRTRRKNPETTTEDFVALLSRAEVKKFAKKLSANLTKI